MPRLHAKIYGRVQGVFFRAWTQKTAQSLALTGWVRNLPEGSVEVLAEGNREQLGEFHRLCQQGPPSARVERFEVEWLEATAEFKDFQIRR